MTIEAIVGESITKAVARSKTEMTREDVNKCDLIFNGITIEVNQQSYIPDIGKIYRLKHHIRATK